MIDKLKEALGKTKAGLLLVPTGRYTGKVTPSIPFASLNNLHIGDPDIGGSIDLIAGQTCRGGFETTMSEDYNEQSDGMTAKEVIDEKCSEVGLDQLLKEVAGDIVGYGESLVWKGSGYKLPKQLVRMLPASIKTFNFDKDGLLLQSVSTYTRDFAENEIIRFSYNRIGQQPLGFGILQALGNAFSYYGTTREPFAVIKARITQAMADQIEDFSAPNQMWILPDCPKDDLPAYQNQLKTLKKGQRLAYNKAGASVINAIPERMRGMDMYVEKIWNSFYLGCGTPIPQLFAGDQMTQASAASALYVAEIGKIDDLRRYLKRTVEQEIFIPWLEAAGLDPQKAKVRMNWRLMQRPDTNVLLPVLQKSREAGDLTRTEIRKIYTDMGVPIDPEATKELEEEEKKKQEMQDKMFQQQTDRKGENATNPNQPIQSGQKIYQSRREEGKNAGQKQ